MAASTYRRGSTAPAITGLQRALNQRVTGIFDAPTYYATIAFQRKHGLKATGEIDPKTREALLGSDEADTTGQPAKAADTGAPSES